MYKTNKIVSRNQIPDKYWASRPKIVQSLARLFLKLFGWKVEGFVPPIKGNENIIIIAGPHTSNLGWYFWFCCNIGIRCKNNFFW